jgi:hypothetical protein
MPKVTSRKDLTLGFKGYRNRETYNLRVVIRSDGDLQINLNSGAREFVRPLSREDAAEIVGFLTTFLLTPNQQG